MRLLVEAAGAERYRRALRCENGLFPKEVVFPVPAEASEFVSTVLAVLEAVDADFLLLVPLPTKSEEKMDSLRAEVSALLQQTPVPILLLPPRLRLPTPPFTSILIPLSGEKKESTALKLGLRIAEAQNLPVDLIHITGPETESPLSNPALESTAD